MKNLELRSSLIKSGAILALFIFFIYSFAVNDSGGISGTIGSLISGLTFLIGLFIAVVLSVSILICIYFGILYLYDPVISKKTYEEFKTIGNASTTKIPFRPKCCVPKTPTAKASTLSKDDLQPIQANQAQLGAQLDNIAFTVETLQKSLNVFNAALNSTKDEINSLEKKAATIEESLETKATTDSIDESSKILTSELEGLKGSIQPLAGKLTSLEENVASLLPQEKDESDGVQELINSALDSLKGDIKAVQDDMAKLQTAPANGPKANASNSDVDSKHRILSYFTKKTDQKKFSVSVQKAIDKGMTYAQIGDSLTDVLSKEANEIIADHPSLTKDYIRTIRQKE